MPFYSGTKLTIELTSDGEESLVEAESHVPASNDGCKAQLRHLLKLFAETGRLRSGEQINSEGDGFFAIKTRCCLRAYGWYHRYRRSVFMVSHFICKKRQKLNPADIARANKNRTDCYRGEGHER